MAINSLFKAPIWRSSASTCQPSVPPLHVSHAAQRIFAVSSTRRSFSTCAACNRRDVSAASTEIAMSSPKKSARTSPLIPSRSFHINQDYLLAIPIRRIHGKTVNHLCISQQPVGMRHQRDVLRQEGVEVLGDAIHSRYGKVKTTECSACRNRSWIILNGSENVQAYSRRIPDRISHAVHRHGANPAHQNEPQDMLLAPWQPPIRQNRCPSLDYAQRSPREPPCRHPARTPITDRPITVLDGSRQPDRQVVQRHLGEEPRLLPA